MDKLKRATRLRMAQTGEPYTVARKAVMDGQAAGQVTQGGSPSLMPLGPGITREAGDDGDTQLDQVRDRGPAEPEPDSGG